MLDFCECCTGTGEPISGKPCICGGHGTAQAEKLGLREELHKRDQVIAELKLWLDSWPVRKAMPEKYYSLVVNKIKELELLHL